VADIKAVESDPLLSRLFLNRRHLILNGMISTVTITQKYTLLPARIRSQMSWMILFKLNGLDMETVYRDVVTLPRATWERVLDFVFDKHAELKMQTSDATTTAA
jgi:hypothetical protein